MEEVEKLLRSSVKRKVLELLSKNARTPSQLADLLNTRLPNITVIVKELSDSFLIHQVNPSETRGKVYVLTEKGHSILSELNTQMRNRVLRNVGEHKGQINSSGTVIDNSSFVLKCLFNKAVRKGDLVSTSFSSEIGINTTVGIISEVIKIENNNTEKKEDSNNNSSYITKVEVLGTLLDGAKISNGSMVPIGNPVDFASPQHIDNLTGAQPQSDPVVIGKSAGRPPVDISMPYSSIGNALIIGSVGSGKSGLTKDIISELLSKNISVCYFTNHHDPDSFLKKGIPLSAADTIKIDLSEVLKTRVIKINGNERKFLVDDDFLGIIQNFVGTNPDTNKNTSKIMDMANPKDLYPLSVDEIKCLENLEKTDEVNMAYLFESYKNIIINTGKIPSHITNAFYLWYMEKIRDHVSNNPEQKLALIIDHADKLLDDDIYRSRLNDLLLSFRLYHNQSLITLIFSDGLFDYNHSFDFTTIIMSNMPSGRYEKIFKDRLVDNLCSGQFYYDLGYSELLLFLEGMRHPLAFRSISSKSVVEMIKEGEDAESKIGEILSTNGFDVSMHAKITGDTSDHSIKILAQKDNLSYLIDIMSLSDYSIIQGLHVGKTVYKAVDIGRNHNEKYGIVFTGSRPFPKVERIVGKYADFYVHLDDLQSFLENPRYNLYPWEKHPTKQT